MTRQARNRMQMTFNRRGAMRLFGAGLTALGAGWPLSRARADGDEIVISHGYSFYGDLKYPADYPHFDYVNPNAPKGGEVSLSALGTFDNLNRFSHKGARFAAYAGCIAEGMFGEGPFGTTTPADSITDAYCLLAETVEYPRSQEWCIFHMRPEARFANGTPVTAHDALFTHELFLEQAIPSYARSVSERVIGAEVIDDHTIKYTFAEGISRRSLISQVGGTPVFSKAWYAETGDRLDEPSQQTPMGSGPYVVDSYEINRYITYKRNPDYWGWHLPINVGRHNFDRIRVEYFADDAAEFEAFKAGIYTFRPEGSTKKWATGYDFPAVQNGDVKLHEIPDGTPPSPSGFVFNMLRDPFKDIRVREALSLAYNFEWTSTSLQYGLTKQRDSFSEGTEIEAKGPPEGMEKAFLEALGELVPPEMFTEPAVVAHTSNPDTPVDRRNKRKALKLLAEAGWNVGSDGKLANDAGEQMAFKVMLSTSTPATIEAIITTYVKTLDSFGVVATMEKVDSAQYAQRYYDKDWDMMYFRNQALLTVGTQLLQAYGSKSAVVSSYNPQSLQSPLVDAIIDGALKAQSRDEEVAALMALDRTLRQMRIQVPGGYVAENWLAAYDFYEHPENLPPLDPGYLDFWWFNEEKFEALKTQGVLR